MDRITVAIWVAGGYFVGLIPLFFAFGMAELFGALMNPLFFFVSYLLLPVPALLALAALRRAHTHFGDVSSLAVSAASTFAVLTVCTVTHGWTNENAPTVLRPALATAAAIFELQSPFHGTQILVRFLAAAFGGALLGSFWRRRWWLQQP